MLSIIKSGGKQYRVKEGDTIKVEMLNQEVGTKISLETLALYDDSKLVTNQDKSFSGKVEAVVKKHFRDKKLIIFRHRRRKNSRRKNGHRQYLTALEISKVSFS